MLHDGCAFRPTKISTAEECGPAPHKSEDDFAADMTANIPFAFKLHSVLVRGSAAAPGKR
jgi:hypothetical protein